ncbi:MAG: DNA ligase D [Rhodospirillaceae bacterium]|nr:DNA ligase D [Rhodospirillaceae bacterium]
MSPPAPSHRPPAGAGRRAGDPLGAYRAKRDFRRTPEPEGGREAAKGGDRHFVVQKHAARRLHYDFRLELDGVLKSWAVTRGPSLDPADRRLAVHVEDHPIDYAGFEGIIPAGEYGGGTVMVWDRGTWEPVGDPRAGYAEGKLKFRLHGQKLRGGWTLVRMGGRARREKRDNWLLIKERDDEARPGDGERLLEEAGRSALSGRAMDEIAAARDRVWHSDERASPADTAATARRPRAPAVDVESIKGAMAAALPDFIEPQLPTLQDRPPAGDDWLHEIKLDGYRLLCRIEGGRRRGGVRLLTRTGLDWTGRFGAVAQAAGKLPVKTALIDGEVVAADAAGLTSFAALQQALSTGETAALVYYAFDLLHLDGRDLTRAALEARKQTLRDLLAAAPPGGTIRYSDHQAGHGAAVLEAACRLGLEGIVSKRRDAPYQPGRGRSWIKCKCTGREEFAIAGYVTSTVSRHAVGSLALGAYRDGALVYVGRVGTGFDAETSRALFARLKVLERRTPPFEAALPAVARRGVHWVEPRLVCVVEYRGWTEDGLLRHASFVGLREDKPANEVELPRRVAARSAPRSAASDGTDIADVRLTHPDRILVPQSGLTKRGLAEFYAEIADWVLPHVAGRPLSLVRCPEGQDGPCFYHKHAAAGWPGSIHRVAVSPDEPPYMWIDDLAGLVGLVQMSAVELHPWGSRVDDLDRPDRIVFDLDPAPDVPWERVIEAAVECRTRLAGLDLESFVKTTGGKGLHVVVPIAPRHDWAEVKAFAHAFAERLARDSNRAYTTNMAKSARRGRIFIDYLRNDRGATAVAAYTVRARPGAPVAPPLAWPELSPALRSDHFTVTTLPRRLAGLMKDPWAGMATLRQRITARARRALGLA